MTKYYCDFCGVEICSDTTIKITGNVRGYDGLSIVNFHFHKNCFEHMIGKDAVEKAERIVNERKNKEKNK